MGFVVGETSVIAEDVSIWHNVTLGSTLNDSGTHRHPRIGTGAVIGAGAILLGGITIGANANVAAGAIVVGDILRAWSPSVQKQLFAALPALCLQNQRQQSDERILWYRSPAAGHL